MAEETVLVHARRDANGAETRVSLVYDDVTGAFGLDYEYRLNPTWGIGGLFNADSNFDQSIVGLQRLNSHGRHVIPPGRTINR